MEHKHHERGLSDAERRDLLKALGIGGAVAAGSATLEDVRQVVSTERSDALASVGQAVQSDLTGELDAELLTNAQARFADRVSALPVVAERGLPEESPRDEFVGVADAGRPVYDHLAEVGFFESTTDHLPEFTPDYLQTSAKAFVGSKALAEPLTDLGLSGEEGVDLVGTVIANAERINERHWVATDEIQREQIEFGEYIPTMTRAAAGGVLLWLEDIDQHLYKKKVLLTDEIVNDAVWYAQSMGAGFYLMTEGARIIAEESGILSDDELAALLSSGFALQVISQYLLAEDVYWITEEMRAPRAK